MRNNVVTIATTATLIASQLAVPAMPQATTLPYPNPGGPQIQPPRPGGPQIQPPRPGGPQIVLPVRPGDGYAGTIRCESRNNKRSEEHTSELQSLRSTSYAVFCLQKKNDKKD